jgi:hypothetical protein
VVEPLTSGGVRTAIEGDRGMADGIANDLSAQAEEMRRKARQSLERANALICDARLALDQQDARDASEKSKELAD